ncbi:MAG: hypothetical protein GY947_01260 [Rhodobacteraceae bacterium]|nr:hypothetical protein [Paracoccaceae bacterium]
MIRRILPETSPFYYFPDRESAWLLSRLMEGDARVCELQRSPLAKLLNRPAVQPLVAACGGRLQRRDLLPLAQCGSVTADSRVSRLGEQALFSGPLRGYELSLASWGLEQSDWRWQQISRPGGNLVLQVNFPAEHASMFGRFMEWEHWKQFEWYSHPVRRRGQPTMGWVRLDICLQTGVALIEEIQSDWFREVREQREYLTRQRPRSRDLRNVTAYETALVKAYGRDWQRVCLLAALILLVDEFGCHEVFMHQPDAGAALKDIRYSYPPRSLYSQLPKSFCFEPTRDVPEFLRRPASKTLRRLRGGGKPLFWRLSFD